MERSCSRIGNGVGPVSASVEAIADRWNVADLVSAVLVEFMPAE
jgi:hypothetical protein